VSFRDPQRVRTRRGETALWSVVACAASLWMLWNWPWNIRQNDYASEAEQPLMALLHGHVGSFLSLAPSYGGSLVLRAPFALPGSLAGGGQLLIYRLAALPCLLVLSALGVWLARELRRRGGSLPAAAAAVLLCAANPVSYKALGFGHPEELLGSALCAIAVLLALRGRATWAGLALGIAVVNKQWALLAVGPLLLALPAHRWRALFIAGAVTCAFELPMLLSSPGVEDGTSRLIVAGTGDVFHPWQVFWFFGSHLRSVPASAGSYPHELRTAPSWLSGRVHLIIVWLGLPLTWLAAHRRLPREDALLLLAFLMLLRSWLDPWDLVYDLLPFIVALLTWETAIARRIPVGAGLATALTWFVFQYLQGRVSLDSEAISYLIPATLGLVVLAVVLYRPGCARLRSRAPSLEQRRSYVTPLA
jgi:hypothetical protein